MAYFRAFLALLSSRLSLAELRSAAGGFEAVLLTLFHSRVTGQEARFFQLRTQLVAVVLQQRTGDAVTDSTGLTGHTAAGNAAFDIEADERSASGSPDRSNRQYRGR